MSTAYSKQRAIRSLSLAVIGSFDWLGMCEAPVAPSAAMVGREVIDLEGDRLGPERRLAGWQGCDPPGIPRERGRAGSRLTRLHRLTATVEINGAEVAHARDEETQLQAFRDLWNESRRLSPAMETRRSNGPYAPSMAACLKVGASIRRIGAGQNCGRVPADNIANDRSNTRVEAAAC